MEVINIISFIVLFIGTLGLFYYSNLRKAEDVIQDLEPHDVFEENNESKTVEKQKFLNLDTTIEITAPLYLKNLWLLPTIISLSIFIFTSINFGIESTKVIPLTIISYCLSYLTTKYFLASYKTNYIQDIERNIPVIMERLVMAVESGLDLIAATKALIENDSLSKQKNSVVKLLSLVIKLTESGLSFNQSLEEVASKTYITSIRHAFTYLALAYQQGSELIMPLRELSDATQLRYEEKIEEQIAKLPIKATCPLIMIFAGLVIFFVTSPLLQIIQMTSKALPT